MATLTGTNGPDVIDGPDGEVNFITGANGNDKLSGGFLLDSINGGNGNDTIYGLYGDDLLFGGDGDDSISGGAGDDEVSDGKGSDYVDAGRGDDFVDLGFGAAADINTVLAGGGDDTIRAGIGFDKLDGGRGVDVIDYGAALGGVNVNLATGVGSAGAGGDTFANIEDALGSKFADTLTGGVGSNVLEGLGGADSLIGGAGSDFLLGGGGDDVVEGGRGSDQMDGGGGTDLLSYRFSSGVVIDLGVGEGTGGDAAGDRFTGFENLQGSIGHDELGGNAIANLIDARSGDDQVFGGGGNDTLLGAEGSDTLFGGDANDHMFGEGDADVFFFTTGFGDDVIHDFEDGADLLAGSVSYEDLVVSAVDADGDTFQDDTLLADPLSSDTIVLIDVDASDVSADDFVS